MKKKFLFLFVALSISLLVKADPVTVSVPAAGMLIKTLEASYTLTDITELTVSGSIDARDFRTIRNDLSNLEKLDLSATTIEAYTGTEGTAFNAMDGKKINKTYPANAVPEYSFYVPAIRSRSGVEIAPERKLKLQSLQLPAGITAIGNYALGKQLCLTSTTRDLSVYTQLETLGDYVFYQDSALVSVILPSSIKSLGSNLFSGCVNISAINFEAPSSLTAIGAGFFAGMAKLKKVVIPASIKTLPVNAFIYNSNTYFTGDSIGVDPANTIFSSDKGILYNKAQDTLLLCPPGLSAPVIPSTVKNIGNEAFRYGTLTTINIPASVQSIGANAFSNSKIADLSFSAGSTLETIGNQAFYRDTFLVAVDLPTGLKTIENEVFNGDLALKTIVLPAGITSIGNSVFAYTALESADFSSLTALSSWGTSTFKSCTNLTSVQLPPDYAAIPESTFSACQSLKSIDIPASVKTIGASAFYSSKLETVTLPEALETINSSAFSITPLKSVFIPQSVTTIRQGSTGSPFNRIPGKITVHAENPNYSGIDGILYNKDTTVLIEAPTFLASSIVLPKTVTTIELYAFQFDSLLTSIELPASLLETQPIKNSAFAGCTALRQIIVKTQTPPSFANNQYPFDSMSPTTCTLYVPKGTVEAYREANKWKEFTTIKEAGLFYDLGYGHPYRISPNGKYLSGSGFLWENKENGDNSLISIPQSASAHDVNDAGVIAADFADNTYLVNGAPVTSGGVYKDGTWYSLGLGRYGSSAGSLEAGSHVNAITADGWVFGMSHEKNSVAKIVPMVWKPDETGQYTDTLVYRFPEDHLPVADRTQGSLFYDASAHGEIACGWATQSSTFGGRQSIVWTSPSEYKIIARETLGEAHDVSPNGKFVALTTARKAALYYVEKDSLVVFGPDGTAASAVSDDGTVVGVRSTAAEGRKGFIWSDKLGYIELKDFIEKYTPEITLSEDFQFSNDESDFFMDVPMTISGDGLIISGWRGAGAIRKVWVIALPAPLDLVGRPFALTAYAAPQTRNVVELKWSAPEEINAHLLDFYDIYRNDSLIARIESDQTSYIDNDAPSGNVSYTISAIYDYEPSTSAFLESNKSEPVRIAIVDSYDLPFHDGFDSGNYGTNYWEVSPSAIASEWTFSATDYKSDLGVSSLFVTVGDRSAYSHTLATKPLDATGQSTVIASFLYKIASSSDVLVGVKDTVHFEVADIQSTEWTTVKSYVLSSVHDWEAESLDISDLVAGKVFRARFRAVSGANRNYMLFNMDEFTIAIIPSIAPSGVVAKRKATSSDVEIVWQDPSGSYGLTYAQSLKKSTTLGNKGTPFIGVNKFDPADLSAYKDLYLTSISAYINAKGTKATIDTKLKLAVFVGDNRVVTQEIESFEGNAWNTFALSTPLQITDEAALSFGIEVAEHDSLSFPLSSDNIPGISGKSDAFSEDGGVTWKTLTDWEFQHNWLIIGNVRETAAASERTPHIPGYEVYRGDVKINTGLTFGQTFVDTTLLSTEEACYKVKTYSIFGGTSDFSEEGCLSIVDAIPSVPSENAVIYPNPANEWIRIDGDFSTVTFLDLNGRKVLEAKESPVKIKSLNAGTYAVDITTPEGSKVRTKVIIRK